MIVVALDLTVANREQRVSGFTRDLSEAHEK
jgi:hypothetical protein